MTVSAQWFNISPDGLLDFTVDLVDWLKGDTIDTVLWTLPSPLEESSKSKTPTTATVFATGAVMGDDYPVKAYVETTGGRHESFHLLITGART